MGELVDNTMAADNRTGNGSVGRPYLRLVSGGGLTSGGRGPDAAASGGGQDITPVQDSVPQVLVAGASAERRAAIVEELMTTLPNGTRLEEAGETWEVLQQASRSRIVVLAGDHGDEGVAALVRLLGHRHPRLPVMTLGGPASGAHGVGRSAHA